MLQERRFPSWSISLASQQGFRVGVSKPLSCAAVTAIKCTQLQIQRIAMPQHPVNSVQPLHACACPWYRPYPTLHPSQALSQPAEWQEASSCLTSSKKKWRRDKGSSRQEGRSGFKECCWGWGGAGTAPETCWINVENWYSWWQFGGLPTSDKVNLFLQNTHHRWKHTSKLLVPRLSWRLWHFPVCLVFTSFSFRNDSQMLYYFTLRRLLSINPCVCVWRGGGSWSCIINMTHLFLIIKEV